MFEGIISFFKKFGKTEQVDVKSKDTAKERLHLVLMQDRANVSADFLEMMKQEIIDVIKKYITVDESEIDVRLTNKTNEDGTSGAPALYANIPIVSIKNENNNKQDKKGEEKEVTNKESEKENETDKKEKKAVKKDSKPKENAEKDNKDNVEEDNNKEKNKEDKEEEAEKEEKSEKADKKETSKKTIIAKKTTKKATKKTTATKKA